MALDFGNITKKDLTEEISKRTGITQTDAKIILEKFLDEIVFAISNGGNIEIRGFGRFKVKPRKERTARNPRSGETLSVPAGVKPVFEPSKELKSLLIHTILKEKKIQPEKINGK